MESRTKRGRVTDAWERYTKATDRRHFWSDKRLDVSARDGAHFFTCAQRYVLCDPNARRDAPPLLALPGLASRLAAARSFNAPTCPSELLGALFQVGGGILDRIVVTLACTLLGAGERTPLGACELAVRRLLRAAGSSRTEYSRLLHYGLQRRYCFTDTHLPDSLLLVAVFQQLQLPFALCAEEIPYPVPLHRYPALPGGHALIVESKRLLKRSFFVRSHPRDMLFANFTVWLGVLNAAEGVDDFLSLLEVYSELSSVHAFIADHYGEVCGQDLMFGVTELMNLWISQELLVISLEV